jgi:hypothetical protein
MVIDAFIVRKFHPNIRTFLRPFWEIYLPSQVMWLPPEACLMSHQASHHASCIMHHHTPTIPIIYMLGIPENTHSPYSPSTGVKQNPKYGPQGFQP